MERMTLSRAKSVFGNLMKIAREGKLTEYQKGQLSRARQILRQSAKPAMNKKRNSSAPIKIYGRCLRIEAVKLRNHTYGGKPTGPKQKYFHDFTTKNAIIYGLPDGSLLIKSK